MADFPFQLSIQRCSLKKQTEIITCTALLREIPFKRQVYQGKWNNREVIVKIFLIGFGRKYRFQREWRGLETLKQKGLNSPEPLFYGLTEAKRWAMVVEKIPDSSTVLEIYNRTTDKSKKLSLLVLLCKELAKQHNKGVLQNDLHLGNFLLSADKVFALDPGQMEFHSRQIPRKKSIGQLAMLACCLPADEKEPVKRLLEEYMNARSWKTKKSDETLFEKKIVQYRRRGIRKGLKKSLRTGKRNLRIKENDELAVFDRAFCRNIEPLDFIKQADSLMDNGQILKNGNTSYVSRIAWNGKDVVVKRYNHKGFIHSLCHTIKKSRARRTWLNGNRLIMLNIPTPKPLAYVEKYKGPILWQSYIITEYIDGQKLHNFLRDENVTEESRNRMLQKTEALINRLHQNRISHGDLKHSNIIISDNKPYLLDLDGMKVHKCSWFYKSQRTKDIARFKKFW